MDVRKLLVQQLLLSAMLPGKTNTLVAPTSDSSRQHYRLCFSTIDLVLYFEISKAYALSRSQYSNPTFTLK